MNEHHFYFDWRGALGEYGEIREIVAGTFEFLVGLLACMQGLLNSMEFFVANFILLVMEYIDGKYISG